MRNVTSELGLLKEAKQAKKDQFSLYNTKLPFQHTRDFTVIHSYRDLETLLLYHIEDNVYTISYGLQSFIIYNKCNQMRIIYETKLQNVD